MTNKYDITNMDVDQLNRVLRDLRKRRGTIGFRIFAVISILLIFLLPQILHIKSVLSVKLYFILVGIPALIFAYIIPLRIVPHLKCPYCHKTLENSITQMVLIATKNCSHCGKKLLSNQSKIEEK